MNITKSDALLNGRVLREACCQTLQLNREEEKYISDNRIYSGLFFIHPKAAATGNKPQSLRLLRNYVNPKVTMRFFYTEQN